MTVNHGYAKEVAVETLTLSVAEAAKRLGLGRNRVYLLLRLGRIPAVKAGKRFRVPVDALREVLRDPERLSVKGEEAER